MRHIILLSHEILAYGLLQTARHVLGSRRAVLHIVRI